MKQKNPKYCSKKCSAICTNREYKRRKLTKKCKVCDKLIISDRTYCNEHKDVHRFAKDMTFGEAKYYDKKPFHLYQLIRSRARLIIERLGISKCQNCGYDKHFEVCHKKPIREFSDDILISVINSLDNLLILCPNCHWEYDHGFLII